MTAPRQPLTREQFETVVLQCVDLLHGYARRLTKGRGSEDLVQETVAKALAARAQYYAGTNFKAWIFKIMTNLYIDQYRRRDRAPNEVPIDAVFGLEAAPATVRLENADSVTDPEVLSRVLPDPMLKALDSIPESHRAAILLRELGGFAYREIAEILECPIGTVMSRLHYARNSLRESLASMARDEGLLPEETGTDGDTTTESYAG